MSVKDRIKALDLTSQGAAVFNGTYQILGAPLSHPCFYIRIANSTNKDITVSYDGGITDHEYIISGDTLNVPAQLNSQPTNNRCLFAKGTAIYIKSPVAGAGSVYLSGYYQD